MFVCMFVCLYVCLYVCMYVRTNEMSAQMKLQNVNFKNKDITVIELETTDSRDSFTTIETTPTNIFINLSIWTKIPDQQIAFSASQYCFSQFDYQLIYQTFFLPILFPERHYVSVLPRRSLVYFHLRKAEGAPFVYRGSTVELWETNPCRKCSMKNRYLRILGNWYLNARSLRSFVKKKTDSFTRTKSFASRKSTLML